MRGPIYLPHRRIHHAGGLVPYASWDQAAENVSDGLAWLAEGGAAANETGVDGTGNLTGSDLVLTQSGSVPAATGSPAYRSLAAGKKFTWTADGAASFFGDNTNSLIMRVNNVVTTSDYLVSLSSNSGNDAMALIIDGSQKLRAIGRYGGAGYLDATTTDAIPAATTVYIALWSDGTYVRAGFTTSFPTKWSDFSSTTRLSATTANGKLSGTFTSYDIVGASGGQQFDWYWTVVSPNCLIDNAS